MKMLINGKRLFDSIISYIGYSLVAGSIMADTCHAPLGLKERGVMLIPRLAPGVIHMRLLQSR
jgi:hypothetical protein